MQVARARFSNKSSLERTKMTPASEKTQQNWATAWVLTNGMAGFETQVLGVAEAMGLAPEIKRVAPPVPWRWAAPWGPAAQAEEIAPPWPDLLIVSGRQSIPYARHIRARSGGKTFVAVLQDPRLSPTQFDFVWAPKHDRLAGPNVLSTLLSPHRLTSERLAAEAKKIMSAIAHLPRPRIAVLLGGSNSVYRLDETAARHIGHLLARAADQSRGGLMITPSRRTGPRALQIIRDCVRDKSHVIWDETGDNPYFGYLGSADAVIVTCDSVNMISEAAATGKPVHVIELKGGSSRSRRFLEGVYAQGAARPFKGRLESWACSPLNATWEIADAIERAMRAWRPKPA
jgi:uncharacterized protein